MAFDNLFFLCFQLIFYIGAPLMLGTGVYYIFLCFRNPRKEAGFSSWSTGEGKMEVLTFPGRPGLINNAVMKYTYSVNGQDYVGKNLTLYPNTLFGKGSLQPIKDKYAEGSRVTVYYNPENPKEAVLEKETGNMKVYFLVWGILNVLLGLLMGAIIVMGLMDI
jgi:hypothetical protein